MTSGMDIKSHLSRSSYFGFLDDGAKITVYSLVTIRGD